MRMSLEILGRFSEESCEIVVESIYSARTFGHEWLKEEEECI